MQCSDRHLTTYLVDLECIAVGAEEVKTNPDAGLGLVVAETARRADESRLRVLACVDCAEAYKALGLGAKRAREPQT